MLINHRVQLLCLVFVIGTFDYISAVRKEEQDAGKLKKDSPIKQRK